jgi:AMP-polyphosphate phosphotransferase
MAIDLTAFEQGERFSGDYSAELAGLQERLSRLQLAQIVGGGRAMILFEGWDGGGRKGALRALAGALDPCHVAVHCPSAAEAGSGRHWLAPFWSRLPRNGETAMFYGSWYRHAVDRRAGKELIEKAWARTCDEINEFEAQQTDHGTLLVKLFFHVTADVQARRLAERDADPWFHALSLQQGGDPPSRAALQSGWNETFRRTDTRWARWTVIDAGDERSARIAALSAVASALERAVPNEPPRVATEA